jgi:2'-hydroxyisoflavone reductase
VLAPGRPERVVQFIDVRDLAEWTMRMVEQRATGIYSADGPTQPIEMGRLLEICRQVSHSSARFFWVAEEFLLNKNVEPWKELPLWMPESDPALAGFFQFNVEKAKAAGLTYRPTEETVRATLEWNATRPAGRERKAGMDRNKEASLLETWQKFSV